MQALDDPAVARYRLTVDQYHRMAEVGVLEPDARLELIDGALIEKARVGSMHCSIVLRLTRLLLRATDGVACVAVRAPLRLDRWNELEPDLSVVKFRVDYYASALPTAVDALLAIEVADTTLAHDLGAKARLYAAHGVPAYWVFDLVNGQMHAHAEPLANGYRRIDPLTNLGPMPVPGLPGTTVDLSRILSKELVSNFRNRCSQIRHR